MASNVLHHPLHVIFSTSTTIRILYCVHDCSIGMLIIILNNQVKHDAFVWNVRKERQVPDAMFPTENSWLTASTRTSLVHGTALCEPLHMGICIHFVSSTVVSITNCFYSAGYSVCLGCTYKWIRSQRDELTLEPGVPKKYFPIKP